MSIKDFTEKIKLFLGDIKNRVYSREKGLKIKDDIYIIITIILVGTASFGLGKLSSFEKNKVPISIFKTQDAMYATVMKDTLNNPQPNSIAQTSGGVVASKSGTKYYYPWCSGVSKIKEGNKVWYKSIEEARSAGLTPASNCVGLK